MLGRSVWVIPKEFKLSVKTGVSSSALPWFVTSRLSSKQREGLSDIEQACLALEKEGLPCPLDVDFEQWVRNNFSYICFKYIEKYPNAYKPKQPKPPKTKKKSKAQRRAEAELRRANKQPRPAKVKNTLVKIAGVDVSSNEFLSTYEWRKLRMQAFKKYGSKCMCCGATPATGAVINVDHIKPRRLFPSLALDINNLQILCHECNHGKGNWDQTDWR